MTPKPEKGAPDPVRDYCRAHGYSVLAIEGGIEYLLKEWEGVASSLARGDVQYRDDYLNDMDGRRILYEVLPLASDQQRETLQGRLAAADALHRAHTVETDKCIWGDDNAIEAGWTREIDWWYFRRPRTVGEDWR